MSQAAKFFNRKALLNNKIYATQQPNFTYLNNVLYQPGLKHIIDQVSYIQKEFNTIAFIGNQPDYFLNNLPPNIKPKQVFIADIHESLVSLNMKKIQDKKRDYEIFPLVIDEEIWCLKPNSVDLIVSSGHLHFVNELQVTFQRFLDSLQPDGVLIGSIFGESTLEEVRIAFTLAESERSGGISPHVNPFITIVEMGNLLTRCKFNIPTIYQDKRLIEFDNCLQCFQFLQDLGENSALQSYRPGVLKDVLYATCALFDSLNREQNGLRTVTFEEIFFSGWKYHESQPKPKQRGSAEFSLKDLKTQISDMDDDVEVRSGQLEEEDEKKQN